MEEVGTITRAAGVVGFFTLLSRIVGFLRDVVIGYLFGARGEADAFFVAFRIPNLLRRLTAEGALTAAFVPLFTESLTHRGKDEAVRIGRIIFTFAGLALAAITLFGMLLARPLTELFAPGFLADAGKFSLTVFLTRIMFPYIFFISLVALSMGVLNSFRHFMAPALAPVLLNVSIIACAFLLRPFLDQPVVALGYGVLLGGVAQLLLQVPYLSRHGFSYAPDFDYADPALRRLVFLMGPAVFGAGIYQLNVLVSTLLASLLPEGSVSYLYYADRIVEFPVGIFAIALGTAALPSFSSLVARREFAELRRGILQGLGLVNFIALPATLGLVVISVPVFAVFFQRGAFDAATTHYSASALVYFSLGLWGISGAKLVVQAFYAMGDMRTPVWVGFWSFVLNFFSSLVFMGKLAPTPDSNILGQAIVFLSQKLGFLSLAHGGLALATSVSATFNFLALLFLLRRRIGILPFGEFFSSFSRSLLGSLAMALPLFLIVRQVDWVAPGRAFLIQGALLLSVVAGGAFIYVLLASLFRSPELRVLRDAATKKRSF